MPSINAVRAIGIVADRTAKGGIIALTRSASLAYARQGIRMNPLCPETTYAAATPTPYSMGTPAGANRDSPCPWTAVYSVDGR